MGTMIAGWVAAGGAGLLVSSITERSFCACLVASLAGMGAYELTTTLIKIALA